MRQAIANVDVETRGKGLTEITAALRRGWPTAGNSRPGS